MGRFDGGLWSCTVIGGGEMHITCVDTYLNADFPGKTLKGSGDYIQRTSVTTFHLMKDTHRRPRVI